MTDANDTITPAGEDSIRPFQVETLDVRGRAVSLSASLDEILKKHDYPEPVARLLGEAILLAALFGASLKFEGRFTLQTSTDGPVSLLVVDYQTPGELRGYARFDKDAIDALPESEAAGASLLGNGHLAMTVDQGSATNRYQGVVPLENMTLEEAVHQYFIQSEQIPTQIRIAVAEILSRSDDGVADRSWRGGAVMVQFLPDSPERIRVRDIPGGDDPAAGAVDDTLEDEDDAWVEARSIAQTIEDHELTDPDIGADRLLFRLFHERGVRVFDAASVRHRCHCSRERITTVISQFSEEERRDMVQDGQIEVTCEFCNAQYRFDPAEFETAG